MRKTILTTVAFAIAAAILAGLASAGSVATLSLHSGAFVPTPAVAGADVVTDWNRTMIAGLEAANPPPPLASRIGAIVQTSVFDAVNGIERRYTPVHVAPAAPRGASPAAAAASAAYTALVALLPAQKPAFDQELQATLAQISDDPSDPGQAVVRGLDWGTTVANDILAWRANDGINAVLPPYVPGTAPGNYQPTPPLFGPPAFRQFANMTPFALTSPSQFLPAGPPPLSSARYAQDLQEVETLGSATSTVRTPEQTQTAVFWQVDTPSALWNRVADDLADANRTTLTQNARLLALMNIGLADATIGIWNAKNHFDAWRPVTAIRTLLDPTWTPLLDDASIPGIPLRPLRRQRRRNGGARLLLRKPHHLHSHLGRPTRRPAQLQLVLLGRPPDRGRPHLRRLPLPLLRRRRRHTRHLRRRLHPQPHRAPHTRTRRRPTDRLTDRANEAPAYNESRCRKATRLVKRPGNRASLPGPAFASPPRGHAHA